MTSFCRASRANDVTSHEVTVSHWTHAPKISRRSLDHDVRIPSGEMRPRRRIPMPYLLPWISTLLAVIMLQSTRAVDFEFPSLEINELAFGSCHKAKSRRQNNKSSPSLPLNAFRNVPNHVPVWIWTGDAVYPPKRGIASVDLLRQEYQNMRTNSSLGYGDFVHDKIVLGTWDDHE